MLLDALKDFSWYNEPENVRFQEDGLLVDSCLKRIFGRIWLIVLIKTTAIFFIRLPEGILH